MPKRPTPSSVAWSKHALDKAAQLSASLLDIEDGLLENHDSRTKNRRGGGDWKLPLGRFTIAYDHPEDNDWTTAKIVTLWRR